jgi:hypothetical protein
MGAFFAIVVFGFVLAVLALVGLALFDLSPFGRHSGHYRDPGTGKRRWESPHLEDGH